MDKKPGVKAYLAYILAAMFLFFEMALQASPSVMTHDLMKDLHVEATGLGVVASFYFYSYTLMQIPAGLMFDRYHIRTLLAASVSVCILGAFLFGFATNVPFAAAGRFLMGIGSAFAFIGVLVVATKWFPAKYFALLVGIAQLLAAVGAMGGEVPLAAAVSTFGWRATINWIAVAGIILIVLILLVFRHSETKPLDTYLPRVTKSLRLVLNDSQTWWVALYAFCMWAPVTAFAELWGVPYLMSLYEISNTLAATAIAMVWIGLGLASPLIGWISDFIENRKLLMNICALVGLLMSIIILYVPQLPFIMIFFLLFGFGLATAGQIITFAIVRDNNRKDVTATAIGFNNMAVVAGGALFQPLVGFLIAYYWNGAVKGGVPQYSIDAYQMALTVIPLSFLIAWLVNFFFIKETYCKPKYP